MAADVASKGGDLFVAAYYKYFDSQRHILHKLYIDSAPILWNGNPFNGIAAFRDFYLQLPATQHDFQSFDVQPLLGKCSCFSVTHADPRTTSRSQPVTQISFSL
ncbi:NTF2- export protein 2 [Entophlyctis sp. JEL0112]|nr:NTF2- export protein 2 [Entophlyctis sp. JEL0112]